MLHNCKIQRQSSDNQIPTEAVDVADYSLAVLIRTDEILPQLLSRQEMTIVSYFTLEFAPVFTGSISKRKCSISV